MSALGDPPRLLDEPDSRDPGDDLLRQALRAGRDDLPGEPELAGLWGKLVPPVGPAGPGGGPGPGAGPAAGGAGAGGAAPGGAGTGGAATGAGAGGATAGALAAKIAGALAAIGLASVLVWQATRTPTPSAPVTSPVPALAASSSVPNGAQPGDVASSNGTPAERSAPAQSAASVPSLSAKPATSAPAGGPSAGAITSAAASAPASALASASAGAPAPSEYELLEQAQAALGSNPAEALALTGRAAELYPRGAMGQEREIIRIQALAGVGRRAEAVAAARAFAASHGDSAYVRRLHQLFPEM